MVHRLSLGLICLNGIKHGYFNILVLDDDTEVAGFILVKLLLFPFSL